MMPVRMENHAGYTLIETVLTIIVLAILAAIIALNLSGLSGVRVDNAINKIVSDLRHAQQLSISTQSRHGMAINSTAQYTIHRDLPPDTAIADPINLGQTLVVNFDTYQQGQLNGVRFSGTTPFCGGSVVEFNGLGAPTDTGGALLTCTGSIGFVGSTRTITIEPNTGKMTY